MLTDIKRISTALITKLKKLDEPGYQDLADKIDPGLQSSFQKLLQSKILLKYWASDDSKYAEERRFAMAELLQPLTEII